MKTIKDIIPGTTNFMSGITKDKLDINNNNLNGLDNNFINQPCTAPANNTIPMIAVIKLITKVIENGVSKSNVGEYTNK